MTKLALLYLRLKARIPVIIVGETGVGKTVLLNILNFLIGGRVSTLAVHAGTKESDIRKWVNKTIARFYLSRLIREHFLRRKKGPENIRIQ